MECVKRTMLICCLQQVRVTVVVMMMTERKEYVGSEELLFLHENIKLKLFKIPSTKLQYLNNINPLFITKVSTAS